MFDALRNLEAWRRSCRLAAEVFKSVERCSNRPFADQISRSSLSVASNIAEGYSREAGRERIRFLVIAKASCTECWTRLLIGAESGLIERQEALRLAEEAEEIAAMIAGLVRYFRSTKQEADLK
jgi:four helix bundle protein